MIQYGDSKVSHLSKRSGAVMPDTGRFKPASEIIGLAARHHGIVGGEAHSLPLPVRKGPALHGVVFFYGEGTRPGEEIIYPPHHVVTIDAESGAIVESRDCIPADFGVSQDPDARTEGFGLDPDLTPDEFWDSFDRFLEISSAVWEIYATGAMSLDPRNVELVREYDSILRRITKEPLRPYCEAIAPDFYEWLGRVTT